MNPTTTPLGALTAAELVHTALCATFDQEFSRVPPPVGILFSGLKPGPWLPALLHTLRAAPAPGYFISVVGADAAMVQQLPAASGLPFNLTVADAIKVRNDAALPAGARRLVIQLGAEEPRLASLKQRGYRDITPADVAKVLAERCAKQPGTAPVIRFWQCLATGRPAAELLALADFAAALAVPGSPAPDLRALLPVLGLLPDHELFGQTEKAAMRRRLLENFNLTQRLLLREPKDLRTAFEIASRAKDSRLHEADALHQAYKAFHQLDLGAPLPPQLMTGLSLDLANWLLKRKPLPAVPAPTGLATEPAVDLPPPDEADPTNPGDPGEADGFGETPDFDLPPDDTTEPGNSGGTSDTGPAPKRRRFFYGLDDAALTLAAEDAPKWLAETRALLKALEAKLAREPEEETPLLGLRHEVEHQLNPLAHSLTLNLLADDRAGGVLTVPLASNATEALQALAQPTQLPETVHNAAWLDTLRQHLHTAGGLVPAFRGEELFEAYWQARAALLARPTDEDAATGKSRRPARLRHADLLAAAPLATLLVREPVRAAAQAAVAAYEALLAEFTAHYADLDRVSASAGARLAGRLLNLDLVEVRAGKTTERAALLACLHPLVLWKHLELTQQVLAGPESAAKLRNVLGRPDAVPEPLRALVLPAANPYPPVPLAQDGWLGSWPIYRPTGLVPATPEPVLLERAARKLAVLYPPVRQHLRLLVYGTDSLDIVADVLRRLVRSGNREERFTHVHLLVALPPTAPRPSLADWPALGSLLDEGLLTIEMQMVATPAAASQWLATQPVHLLVLAGQRDLHPLHFGRDATRLHPLSLPRVLEYDRFAEDSQAALLLRPRGQAENEAEPTATATPFAAFHTLAALLSGQPGREWSGTLTRRAADGTQQLLLPNTVLLLLAGTPPAAGEDALVLARRGGPEGDAVVTKFRQRFVQGVFDVLRELHYQPTEAGVVALLQRLEAVSRASLFEAISIKAGGFDKEKMKGLLGTAVALRWYETSVSQGPYHLTVGFDSELARRWLAQRDQGHQKRPDLLGFRRQPGPHGATAPLIVDLIEVKTSVISGSLDAPDGPGPQLRDGARALWPILHQMGGDLLTDCRRELLREQLFREGQLAAPGTVPADDWAGWVAQVNATLDGTLHPAALNLHLVEVLATVNQPPQPSWEPALSTTSTKPEETLRIRRTRLGENVLGAFVRDEPPPSISGSYGDDAPPPAPPASSPTVPPVLPAQDTPAPTEPVATPTPLPAVPIEAVTPVIAPVLPVSSQPTADELRAQGQAIYQAMQILGYTPAQAVEAAPVDIGPSLLRFRVKPPATLRLPELQSRVRDLQRLLKLNRPPAVDLLPGTEYLSVDVPRSSSETIRLAPVLNEPEPTPPRPPLSFPAGVSPDGRVHWLALPALPHMLVAGTTRSGKTLFLYSILVSLTRRYAPDKLQLLLVDPKQTDFTFFDRLPHLHGQPIIEEPHEAAEALQALATEEMPRRTQLLRQHGCRDIQEYHRLGNAAPALPYLVVVIDEFADLLDSLDRTERKTFEQLVGRLAQRSRSVGIHLILATQRPDSKVVYGNLKNNLDCRAAFRLDSGTSSRVVIDRNGAEDLLGAGDFLLKTPGEIHRLQGFFVSSDELRDL